MKSSFKPLKTHTILTLLLLTVCLFTCFITLFQPKEPGPVRELAKGSMIHQTASRNPHIEKEGVSPHKKGISPFKRRLKRSVKSSPAIRILFTFFGAIIGVGLSFLIFGLLSTSFGENNSHLAGAFSFSIAVLIGIGYIRSFLGIWNIQEKSIRLKSSKFVALAYIGFLLSTILLLTAVSITNPLPWLVLIFAGSSAFFMGMLLWLGKKFRQKSA